MAVALAGTHHDLDGLLDAQAARILPRLAGLYAGIALILSPETSRATRTLLEAAGALIRTSERGGRDASLSLGHKRREGLALALESVAGATHVHLCDFDRVLHWAEFYPEELRTTQHFLREHDFTVLGRTARAFATHPRVQRDTEAIINHAFGLASGLRWDVSAASRGLSRRAVEAIIAGCPDDTIGNDCSWPLFLQRRNGFSITYLETEGLEFETADRYPAAVAAAGGVEGWIAQIDMNPAHWAQRLELARVEVESVVAYRMPEQA